MNNKTRTIIEAVLIADSSVYSSEEQAIMSVVNAFCKSENKRTIDETLNKVAVEQKEKQRNAYEYVSKKEAAKMIGVCAETVKRYTKNGKLKAVKLSPRCLRYKRNDILDFIEKGE